MTLEERIRQLLKEGCPECGQTDEFLIGGPIYIRPDRYGSSVTENEKKEYEAMLYISCPDCEEKITDEDEEWFVGGWCERFPLETNDLDRS